MASARTVAERLAAGVRLGRDGARVAEAMRGGRVAIVSAKLERRPQRWSAEVEPRPHFRSWSGLPPRFLDAPQRYTLAIAGQRYPVAGLAQLMRLGMVHASRPWRVRGRFQLTGTPESLAECLERILTARSPAELERRAGAAWKCFALIRSAPGGAIKEAMLQRGRELCRLRPRWGRLVPRFDERSRRLRIGRAVYRVGRGQNNAGVRWVWAGAAEWTVTTWRRRGVPEERARRAWDWWDAGFPHRALRALEEGRRR